MQSDTFEQALFDNVRAAFLAGWEAAGGKAWKVQNIVQLLQDKKRPE